MTKFDALKKLNISESVKKVIVPTLAGAVAGAVVALGVVCSHNPASAGKIAIANVQEIISASPKVQALQAEQKAKIENLASFVKTANEEISQEKSHVIKQELEKKYSLELAHQKVTFEEEYLKKLAAISDELGQKIQEESKKMGYDVVISKDVTIAGTKDITEDLKNVFK